MALVDYPDSEGSSDEVQIPFRAVQKTVSTGKPTFKKVVDSSNPHKIRVNLPESTKSSATDTDKDEEGPRVKRAKTSGGAFSGFNALLPAPKRAPDAKGLAESNGMKRGGLGAGTSLKTGATPGFSREPMSNRAEHEANHHAEMPTAESCKPVDSSNIMGEAKANPLESSQSMDLQPPKNATMFKPLSVARKPQAKKIKKTTEFGSGTKSANVTEGQGPQLKKSLFSSTENDEVLSPDMSKTDGMYEPLIYQADAEVEDEDPALEGTGSSNPYHQNLPPELDPNLLTSIADTLNLSASARRQLLGRRGRNASASDTSAISIANFNMDSEYAANELLRQAGEQAQHNPVRSINAAGKNSLKQLVSTASSQKDALEEHFATGRRNKKEAGGKYGW